MKDSVARPLTFYNLHFGIYGIIMKILAHVFQLPQHHIISFTSLLGSAGDREEGSGAPCIKDLVLTRRETGCVSLM